MGKRSTFDRRPRDKYPTPLPGVHPLIPVLDSNTNFIEPCAGAGILVGHLETFGHRCVLASDIEPEASGIVRMDALRLTKIDADAIITNPPWDRKLLHPMIEHFSSLLPTWLLFDADWMHTRQAAALVRRCSKIVSVGRLKWIPDSKYSGKDNCAWYLFEAHHDTGPSFIGR